MSRTILVTGASSGIGRATCEGLLDEGFSVVGVARDPARFPRAGPSFHPVPVDLADLDRLPGKIAEILGRFGDLDGAVLAAGSGLFRNLEEISYQEIRSAIELNLLSPLYIARAVLPHLKRRGGGDLLFIGSEAARRGRRLGTVYCAAKFALRGLAQALREECAAGGVRVAIIHPGLVRTAFFDDLDFQPGEEDENALHPGEVADLVRHILTARRGAVFDEIHLTPLKRVVRFRSGKRKGPDARE